MKTRYVKSLKEYDEPCLLDTDRIVEAMKRLRPSKKKMTSIMLDARTMQELKNIGEKKGLPYQALIRFFILDGIARLNSK